MLHLNNMDLVFQHHIEDVLRRERRIRFHPRHRHAQACKVQRAVKNDVIVLRHRLRAVPDILFRAVLTRRRKTCHDAPDRPAPVLPAVRPHQHEPCPDAILLRFKLDEAFVRPNLSFPLATPSGANVKNIVPCNHDFVVSFTYISFRTG